MPTCEAGRADADAKLAVPIVQALHIGTVRQRHFAPLAGVPVLTLTLEEEIHILQLVLQPLRQRPVDADTPPTVARAPIAAAVTVVARVRDLAEVSQKSFRARAAEASASTIGDAGPAVGTRLL